MKKLSIVFVLIMALTGCNPSNEDPTNIEMEVLRASLLEKEFRIDELQNSITEHQETNATLSKQVVQLETSLENERSQKLQLLNGQNQVMTINTNKEHFFYSEDGSLYLLHEYSDEFFDYQYQELVRYTYGQDPESIYKGEDIQFLIDEGTGHILVIDQDHVMIFNQELDLVYEENLDLNDPLIDMTPLLFYADHDYGKSYVLLTKHIQEDTTSLLSFIVFDYRNNKVTLVDKYDMNASSYVVNTKDKELLYEEVGESGYTLYKINLSTKNKEQIALNPTSAFSIYEENGYIYYFDEDTNDFIIYDNN